MSTLKEKIRRDSCLDSKCQGYLDQFKVVCESIQRDFLTYNFYYVCGINSQTFLNIFKEIF